MAVPIISTACVRGRCMNMTLLAFLPFLLLLQLSALFLVHKTKRFEKTTRGIGNTPPKARASSSIKRRRRRLEFVHITKTGGSAIEKAGAEQGIVWGACHYMNISEVGCSRPDLPYTPPDYQSYALTSPWHIRRQRYSNTMSTTRNTPMVIPFMETRTMNLKGTRMTMT